MSVPIWEGPSQIDGAPIRAVLTHGNRNSALCARRQSAVQLWVLPAAEHPMAALKSGRDRSICGTCPFRPWKVVGDEQIAQPRICYVNMAAVGQVFSRQEDVQDFKDVLHRFRGADILRLGAYGDPAALPLPFVQEITEEAKRLGIPKRVGYSKLWRSCDQEWRHLLMASIISREETAEAIDMGWRPFAVRRPGEAVFPGTRQCPKAADGSQVTCASCGGCDGVRHGRDRRMGYSLEVHGSALKGRVVALETLLKTT